jgi:hypothetical protein
LGQRVTALEENKKPSKEPKEDKDDAVRTNNS